MAKRIETTIVLLRRHAQQLRLIGFTIKVGCHVNALHIALGPQSSLVCTAKT